MREHGHVVVALHLGDKSVTLTGLRIPQLTPHLVVKIGHERGVGEPSVVRCHLLHGVVFPQAVVAAEGLEPALHRHAGTSQKDYFLFHAAITLLEGIVIL